MKDLILSLVIIFGLISLFYLGLILLVIFFIFAWAILGTTESLFLGDFINSFFLFNKENPAIIYIATGFSLLFIAYKAIHEKNKKKRKFRGTFIRGQK